MSFAEEIHRGCRRAFIADAWCCVFYGSDPEDYPGVEMPEIPGGSDLFDYVPWGVVEPTDFGEAEAVEALAAVILNHGTSTEAVFLESCKIHGVEPGPRRADLFGHYIGMQSMGHGVSWTDDYPETELETGDVDAPMWEDNHDGSPR